ncbi:hypothetical protein [Halothiobacillus sp.]|jgi:hypothetical protein|uniref:hypothetical protein n=1 Tax=Halothiobacillus sp. TaxID=1891311 RepID=UPI0026346242|nr:hypothetical protein [Halothiobacillus sp.]MDD4967313.1 hypothetical protein [Halothiobacillus sp.]
MLDLDEIGALQTIGTQKINSLSAKELGPLVGYCSLIGSDLLKFAAQQKKSTGEAIVNAVRIGIALGLETQIKDGQIQRRY